MKRSVIIFLDEYRFFIAFFFCRRNKGSVGEWNKIGTTAAQVPEKRCRNKKKGKKKLKNA